MSNELKHNIKVRNSFYNEFFKYKNQVNNHLEGYANYCYNQYKKYRNKVQRDIVQTKSDFYKNVNDNLNPKRAWGSLNELSGRNASFHEPVTLHIAGNMVDKPQEVAQSFADFFVSKVEKIKTSLNYHEPDRVNIKARPQSFHFREVETEEVIEHIKSLSSSGSAGHDTIDNNLVKESCYIIAPVLASIANNCIKNSTYPSKWKIGKVGALHKKGNKSDPANYRPITLLCSLSKVLEKILYRQIASFFDCNNLFDQRQYGFRRGFSTNMAINDYVLSVLLGKESADENKVNALFFDLSAAFDIVDHGRLVTLFKKFGFSDEAASLVESYLSHRSSYVEVETSQSNLFAILYGVPQGSILGPLLYIIYITSIKDIDALLRIIYADDTTCIIRAATIEELEWKTNTAMANVVNYYANAGLKLNPSKTELLNHNNKAVSVITNLEGDRLHSVEHAKMLGIWIDAGLTFHRHIEQIISDVKHRLIVFRKIVKSASFKTRKIFGASILLSKFHYGLSCFAGTDATTLSRLEKYYNKCIRAIHHSDAEEVDDATARHELGFLSLYELIDFYDISLFIRMVRTGIPSSLYSRISFDHSHQTRGAARGTVKLDFIPKSDKLKRSFLPRSYPKYNGCPNALKQGDLRYLSKDVKAYLLLGATNTPHLPVSPSPISPTSPATAIPIQYRKPFIYSAPTPPRPPPEPD